MRFVFFGLVLDASFEERNIGAIMRLSASMSSNAERVNGQYPRCLQTSTGATLASLSNVILPRCCFSLILDLFYSTLPSHVVRYAGRAQRSKRKDQRCKLSSGAGRKTVVFQIARPDGWEAVAGKRKPLGRKPSNSSSSNRNSSRTSRGKS